MVFTIQWYFDLIQVQRGHAPVPVLSRFFYIEKNMSFLLEQTRIKLVSIERGPLYFYLIRR